MGSIQIKKLDQDIHPNQEDGPGHLSKSRMVGPGHSSKSRSWIRTFIEIEEMYTDILPNQGAGPGHSSKSRSWTRTFIEIMQLDPDMHPTYLHNYTATHLHSYASTHLHSYTAIHLQIYTATHLIIYRSTLTFRNARMCSMQGRVEAYSCPGSTI